MLKVVYSNENKCNQICAFNLEKIFDSPTATAIQYELHITKFIGLSRTSRSLKSLSICISTVSVYLLKDHFNVDLDEYRLKIFFNLATTVKFLPWSQPDE